MRIRAARRTRLRYEREQSGDPIHIDVTKLGRIRDGGGWRLDGPEAIECGYAMPVVPSSQPMKNVAASASAPPMTTRRTARSRSLPPIQAAT